jgi:antirestriction protein ArdC
MRRLAGTQPADRRLCLRCHGRQGELRRVGHIQSWLELLKADKRATFTAANKTGAAADFL